MYVDDHQVLSVCIADSTTMCETIRDVSPVTSVLAEQSVYGVCEGPRKYNNIFDF